MKISKSKQELARIIRDNGGWRDGEFSVMCRGGEVLNSSNKPFYDTKHGWCCGGGFGYNRFASDVVAKNWHQTILSREEYFHLYQAPDADGWIAWSGGERPVDTDAMVVCKVRTGKLWRNGKPIAAGVLRWSDTDSSTDIIAYRLHNPEQAKPDYCESVTRSIPEPNDKPTIEQLAADYRNLLDFALRKQQEAYAAKADADEKLRVLELAGEALGLLVSPITTKKEPELVITDWRDLRDGDVIRCVGDAWDNDFEGSEAVVTGIESHDYKYEHRIRARIGEESDWGADFHFIRRP